VTERGVLLVLRKWLPWLAAAFVVWWIISDPHGAAQFAHQAGAFLRHAGTSLATFASGL
jgi:hypothetical protein